MIRLDKYKIKYFMVIFYISSMIFSDLFSSFFIAIYQLLFNFFFLYLCKERKIIITLINLVIINLPITSISILGIDYESLPVTWFMIFITITGCYSLLFGKISANLIILVIVSIIYLFILLIIKNYKLDAINQLITIILFFFSFTIGDYSRRIIINKTKVKHLYDLYLIVCFAFSFQIILQYIYISRTNQIIGYYTLLGGNRKCFGGLFMDFSFASVYLSTGSILIGKELLIKKITISNIFKISIIVLATLITSARTGLYAFIIIMTILIFINLKKLRIYILPLLLIGSIFLTLGLNRMLENRGGTSIFDGSGRLEGYIGMIPYIKNNIWLGIGMGINNLKKITNLGLPHNFYIQYLTQIGLIGTILLQLFMLLIFKLKNKEHVFVFCLIFISSMAIPDILNSKYIIVIIILICLDNPVKKEGNVKNLDSIDYDQSSTLYSRL